MSLVPKVQKVIGKVQEGLDNLKALKIAVADNEKNMETILRCAPQTVKAADMGM